MKDCLENFWEQYNMQSDVFPDKANLTENCILLLQFITNLMMKSFWYNNNTKD